mgnify:CR=1 FL=1
MPDSTDRNIEDKLKEAHSGQQRFVWTRGIVRLLIWLLTLILTDLFIDWVILRGNAGSAFGPLLLVINLGILGYVAWYELARHLKDYDALITALDVEERHPDLSSLLVSYTQLKHTAKNQSNVSTELIAAMRDQAVENSRSLDFRKIVDFGRRMENFSNLEQNHRLSGKFWAKSLSGKFFETKKKNHKRALSASS